MEQANCLQCCLQRPIITHVFATLTKKDENLTLESHKSALKTTQNEEESLINVPELNAKFEKPSKKLKHSRKLD